MKKFLQLLFAVSATAPASAHVETKDIQQYQKDYGAEFFSITEGFEKLRHILLHLMMSTGKISAYCESKEHGNEPDPRSLLDEALPDLYMHAHQIANLFEVDLGGKYEERIQTNRKRFSKK